MLALSYNAGSMFDMPVSSKMFLAASQQPYTPHVHQSRGNSHGSVLCYCSHGAQPRVGPYGELHFFFIIFNSAMCYHVCSAGLGDGAEYVDSTAMGLVLCPSLSGDGTSERSSA